MLNQFTKIKYYIAAVLLLFGVFVWAGLTGTRLLGDDDESTETRDGNPGYGGRSGGRASRFYHK